MLLTVIGVLTLVCENAVAQNVAPTVSITWPGQHASFGGGTVLKIKANAADVDGSITQVQFFADNHLIGVVTNAPFNLLWPIRGDDPRVNLTAVAFDNLGGRTESRAVLISWNLGPYSPAVEIASPANQTLLLAPATFVFSAEVLASVGDGGPVEFFVGTNSVGIVAGHAELAATNPPVSITVSNLAEGTYKLGVRYHGQDGGYCICEWMSKTIRVVKVGAQSPGLTPQSHFQFEVLTSLTGRNTVIEASPNLLNWIPISTNQPSTNSFLFMDSSPATNSQRFYRVFVPPQ